MLANNSLERTPRAGQLIDGSGQADWWLWEQGGRRSAQLESVSPHCGNLLAMGIRLGLR